MVEYGSVPNPTPPFGDVPLPAEGSFVFENGTLISDETQTRDTLQEISAREIAVMIWPSGTIIHALV